MTSSPLLLLSLLLASSAAILVSGDGAGDHGLTHIRVYMHETFSGPNATAATVVPSPLGANATFGRVGVFDDELRAGPDPRNSALLGRYQGVFFGAGLVNPPGLQTAINFVFTAGEYGGSTLAILGPILGFTGAIERSVVGGTGKFRMARGYCLMTAVGNPTPESIVYKLDLFVQMHAA